MSESHRDGTKTLAEAVWQALPAASAATAPEPVTQEDWRAVYEREAADRMAEATGIPALHWRRGETVDWSGLWGEKARKLHSLAGAGGGLMVALLSVQRGAGKTQAAVELLRPRIMRKVSCRYVRAMDIFMAVRSAYAGREQSEADALNRFRHPGLLVIDEIQVRGGSEWENNLLTLLIDDRYAAMKQTVFIGNLDDHGFEKCVGSSIYSRIIESGGIMSFEGIKFRTVERRAVR